MRLPPALRHRRFVLLWLGLMISIAGSQMQLWALFWHIRSLSTQPIAVSGIGLARFLPVLVFSLIGGLVADTYNRRKVLVPDPDDDGPGRPAAGTADDRGPHRASGRFTC